jgi:hypothetical protein
MSRFQALLCVAVFAGSMFGIAACGAEPTKQPRGITPVLIATRTMEPTAPPTATAIIEPPAPATDSPVPVQPNTPIPPPTETAAPSVVLPPTSTPVSIPEIQSDTAAHKTIAQGIESYVRRYSGTESLREVRYDGRRILMVFGVSKTSQTAADVRDSLIRTSQGLLLGLKDVYYTNKGYLADEKNKPPKADFDQAILVGTGPTADGESPLLILRYKQDMLGDDIGLDEAESAWPHAESKLTFFEKAVATGYPTMTPIPTDAFGLAVPPDPPRSYASRGLGMALVLWNESHGPPQEVFDIVDAEYDGRLRVSFWPAGDYPITVIMNNAPDERLPQSLKAARAEVRALLPSDAQLVKTHEKPDEDLITDIYRVPSLIKRYPEGYAWGQADTPGLVMVDYETADHYAWTIYGGSDEKP